MHVEQEVLRAFFLSIFKKIKGIAYRKQKERKICEKMEEDNSRNVECMSGSKLYTSSK